MPEHADGYMFGITNKQNFIISVSCLSLADSFNYFVYKSVHNIINITFNIHQITSIERHPKAGHSALLKLSFNFLLKCIPQYWCYNTTQNTKDYECDGA